MVLSSLSLSLIVSFCSNPSPHLLARFLPPSLLLLPSIQSTFPSFSLFSSLTDGKEGDGVEIEYFLQPFLGEMESVVGIVNFGSSLPHRPSSPHLWSSFSLHLFRQESESDWRETDEKKLREGEKQGRKTRDRERQAALLQILSPSSHHHLLTSRGMSVIEFLP